MKSLMIIDMQKGSFTSETPRYNAKDVICNIENLAGSFRSYGLPVLYIQHNGIFQNNFLPNTEEWEILDEIKPLKNDVVIEKYANDSFYNSKLEAILNEKEIDEIYITGCATDFCVNSTILSAYSKEYRITVVSDGHTTGERPNLSSKGIIDYYHWLWENMIPIKRKIKVKDSSRILREM